MIRKKTKDSRFDRGFKTWSENVALQYRKEMDLAPTDPIDLWVMAKKLGLVVLQVQEIPGIARKTLDVLIQDDPESWSAITLCYNDANMIVLNPTNNTGRTNSNLAHELAHLLIGHAATRVDVTPDNLLLLRNYDRKQEDEANWLAGCLLLPRPALLHIRKKELEIADAMRHYNVSREMFEYRMRITGVDRQTERRRNLATR